MPEDRVFDVTRPSKVSPMATSKPVIVGHQPLTPDPMVRESDSSEPTRIPVSINEPSSQSPSPIIEQQDPPSAPEAQQEVPVTETPPDAGLTGMADTSPETPSTSEPTPDFSEPSSAESVSHDVDPAAMPTAEDMNMQNIDQVPHVEGLHIGQPQRRKGHLGLIALILLVILVLLYLALDSGVIKTSINLPFHVFKQKTATTTTTAPLVSTAPQTSVPAASSLPAGFKTYTIDNTKITFAAPTSWGDPTSTKEGGYSERSTGAKSDGTYVYLVNFSTNKDVQIAVTSGKYLPPARGTLYYDYLQWCVGKPDGKFYKSVLLFATVNKVDTPSTTVCNRGPLTDAQKLDADTIAQTKTLDDQKKILGDLYTTNLKDPDLPVLRILDKTMSNTDEIKKLLKTVKTSAAIKPASSSDQ